MMSLRFEVDVLIHENRLILYAMELSLEEIESHTILNVI
jgi:hypothetical protein